MTSLEQMFSDFFHPQSARSGEFRARVNTPEELHEVLGLLVLVARTSQHLMGRFALLETKMAEMDDRLQAILDDVSAESTQLDSISALVVGLQKQVADALAQSGASAAQMAKVEEIFAAVESNKQKVASALSTGPAQDQTHVDGSVSTGTAPAQTTTDQTTQGTVATGPDPVQSQIDQGAPLAPDSTGRQPVDPLDPVDPDSGAGQGNSGGVK